MAEIGMFLASDDGFTGRIHTLALDADVTFDPTPSPRPAKAPDFRLHLGLDGHGPQIGTGWRHTGEKSGAWVAVQIDDPTFARPMRASLFRADAEGVNWRLVWDRPSPRREPA